MVGGEWRVVCRERGYPGGSLEPVASQYRIPTSNPYPPFTIRHSHLPHALSRIHVIDIGLLMTSGDRGFPPPEQNGTP